MKTSKKKTSFMALKNAFAFHNIKLSSEMAHVVK